MMMKYYDFVFYKEDRTCTTVKGFWAFDKNEAWSIADDWAYRNGYVDYRMKED